MSASKCISKLAQSRPPSASLILHNHSLQVHLHTCTITAAKCISKLAQSRQPSASPNSHDHGLKVHLHTRSISASKCISKLARSQPPSVSPNLLDYGIQTSSITAWECISKFTWLQGGKMVELEGRQPIMNTPPHLAWYPKGICEKEWF